MTALRPATWPFLLAISCGGGSSARPAESAADGDGEAAGEGSGEEAASGAEEEGGEGEPAPRRIACDDGTCSVCGEGLCPAGWYCNESAKGGPACGWLPDCAAKPSCACVGRVFSSCSCEERGGGVHLTCG